MFLELITDVRIVLFFYFLLTKLFLELIENVASISFRRDGNHSLTTTTTTIIQPGEAPF